MLLVTGCRGPSFGQGCCQVLEQVVLGFAERNNRPRNPLPGKYTEQLISIP